MGSCFGAGLKDRDFLGVGVQGAELVGEAWVAGGVRPRARAGEGLGSLPRLIELEERNRLQKVLYFWVSASLRAGKGQSSAVAAAS